MLNHLAKIAPSGRWYVRHPSGMGSVMFFNDKKKKALILDAKWRSNQRFGSYGIQSKNYQLRENWFEIETDLSDKYFLDNFPRDPQSSRKNCNNWMKLNRKRDRYVEELHYVGVPAVSYCRSITVNGIPCDLPNIQLLIRIFSDRETIDEMDPTIDEYPTFALGRRNLQGDWCMGNESESASYNYYAWSSTEYSSGYCWAVYYNGGVSSYGKYAEFAVIPVLEL